MERRTMIEAQRKTLELRRKTLGMRSITSNDMENYNNNEVANEIISKMFYRHESDKKYIDPDFFDAPERHFIPERQSLFIDELERILEPTFSKHQIPLQVRCLERYRNAKKKLNRQLKREMHQLIDFMPTAGDAVSFVRTMSYTTVWPPLHTRLELNVFERDFLKLSKREQYRYKKIMETNFLTQ
ncbi:uncharacterized protein Dana_GF17681 [Drosophila ananassae]|uniref:Uncharacterized protein n=1 Tax=Drosophila ananassae TaxID=7217 RepID=B3LYY2_DROAN|nr:uncharacterized protein LOC6500464 [Drosophila ananassae]EDV41856.1 uncharacterized protein Dana_GF17681 [Drosophila ananassae]